MAATTEVGIQHIQQQVDNCDVIVENIDKIVPKLYKIRQQALAQKEYINDVQNKLLTSFDSVNGTTKVATLTTLALTNIVSDTFTSAAFNTTATGNQRKVFQSLFKYKHEVGTTNHFTTEQIGVSTDRTHGLNLSDVVNITGGLNKYLESANTPTNAHSDVESLLLKPKSTTEGVEPADGAVTLVENTAHSVAIETNYLDTDATNKLTSLLEKANTLTATKIVGFGLT
jgi:hypothetical protein